MRYRITLGQTVIFLLLICCLNLFLYGLVKKNRCDHLNKELMELKYNLKIMPELEKAYHRIESCQGKIVFVFPENFCLPCLQTTLQSITVLEKSIKENLVAIVPCSKKSSFEVYNNSFKLGFENILYRDDFKGMSALAGENVIMFYCSINKDMAGALILTPVHHEIGPYLIKWSESGEKDRQMKRE